MSTTKWKARTMQIGKAQVQAFGVKSNITLHVLNTPKGQLLVHSTDNADEQPFARISVYVQGIELEENEFICKTWTENEWVPQLLKYSYFEDTGKRVPINFVVGQIWRLVNTESGPFEGVVD